MTSAAVRTGQEKGTLLKPPRSQGNSALVAAATHSNCKSDDVKGYLLDPLEMAPSKYTRSAAIWRCLHWKDEEEDEESTAEDGTRQCFFVLNEERR